LTADINRPVTKSESLSIYEDERRKAFISFFCRYGGNVSAACMAVGINRRTYNGWLLKYPEFKEELSDIDESLLDFAEQQLIKNIEAGKEHSLFFFLCNRGKHRGWQDVRKLAAPKLKGINININYVSAGSNPPPAKIIESVVIEDTGDDKDSNES